MDNNQILRLPELMKFIGLSRSSIYQKVLDGEFPKPIPLGARAVGWVSSEIQEWLNGQIQKRGGAK